MTNPFLVAEGLDPRRDNPSYLRNCRTGRERFGTLGVGDRVAVYIMDFSDQGVVANRVTGLISLLDQFLVGIDGTEYGISRVTNVEED